MNKIIKRFFISRHFLICIILLVTILPVKSFSAPLQIPKINLGVEPATTPRDVALTMELLFALTILALAPSILMMMTAFTRIVIVFMFVQRALSLQQMPPRQILIAIALFITFYIMSPVFIEINDNALQPYLNNEIEFGEGLNKAVKPIRIFMFKYTRDKDLALFFDLADLDRPKNRDEVPTHILIPAFILSEIKTAFVIGLLLFIPFIVIDMVVASTLMSMGMIMLPPIMVSVPFKILIFVMVDGWNLLTYQLILSFK